MYVSKAAIVWLDYHRTHSKKILLGLMSGSQINFMVANRLEAYILNFILFDRTDASEGAQPDNPGTGCKPCLSLCPGQCQSYSQKCL